eukprot:TRINITY_DN56994_c0_g1_i1.p1 TRINITY_DN56994_c0_g1~~TRINITY_DN56994_c0_g1_i1.p1  ORF type:complete len:155 (-),score=54.97 TRINITY_DN56994_c0_g1_i1:447-911(-)
MIRRPPRSTLSSSSAASDVYKRQEEENPAEVDIPKSLMDHGTVRKSGSSNLTQIPAFLEYCQLKDQLRTTNGAGGVALPSGGSADLSGLSNRQLATVGDGGSSSANIRAVTDELMEQMQMIARKMASAEPDIVPFLQEELEHVERMISEARASC